MNVIFSPNMVGLHVGRGLGGPFGGARGAESSLTIDHSASEFIQRRIPITQSSAPRPQPQARPIRVPNSIQADSAHHSNPSVRTV